MDSAAEAEAAAAAAAGNKAAGAQAISVRRCWRQGIAKKAAGGGSRRGGEAGRRVGDGDGDRDVGGVASLPPADGGCTAEVASGVGSGTVGVGSCGRTGVVANAVSGGTVTAGTA